MAQIFHPSTNTLSRASLLCLMVLPLGLIVAGSGITRSSYNTKVDVPIEQPVPFSHRHHAYELGIDCRYCHTSVEKSAFAGVPPTHTCMSCHSQIWTNSPLLSPIRESYRTDTPIEWVRVNSVPDFVYFNHSIHVNRGINCNICHGPVEHMLITYRGQPFRMVWCLQCHRNPEKFIRPREEEFNLYWKYQTGIPVNRDNQSLTSKTELTPEEVSLLDGESFTRTPEQLQKGEALVKQYHVNKAQLTDCWICHR